MSYSSIQTFKCALALIALLLSAACASRLPPPRTAGATAAMAAVDADPDAAYIRIVDVGAGLCAVVRVPGDRFMVYDAGHWQEQHCIRAVREIVSTGIIDLMVISHSDADHLGDGARILEEMRVRHTVLAGEPRDTGSWSSLRDALAEETKDGASIHNLQSLPLVPGMALPLGDATVTFIAGWPRWTDPGPTESEARNAISIVVRVTYAGRSVLFTGDTVGRRLTDTDDICKDAEKVMVDRHDAGEVALASDVMVAPHHGANNGSSSCFIQAVSPEFVVFSAGHQHQHPTANAVNRYIAAGVPATRIFRTDLGDDEQGAFEWKRGSIPGCNDPRGDDDVEISLTADGSVEVDYRLTPNGCDSTGGT